MDSWRRTDRSGHRISGVGELHYRVAHARSVPANTSACPVPTLGDLGDKMASSHG